MWSFSIRICVFIALPFAILAEALMYLVIEPSWFFRSLNEKPTLPNWLRLSVVWTNAIRGGSFGSSCALNFLAFTRAFSFPSQTLSLKSFV